MIRINREKTPAPDSLTEQDGAGPKEKRSNVEGYQDYLKKKSADPTSVAEKYEFKFRAYGRREVRTALVALFHGKCAYCEKRFAATQPPDVEHWRPKGRIKLEDGEELLGYYWLAAEWDNLLPSCIDCNRARKQEVALGAGEGETETLGKQDQFPIWREADRWRKPEDEQAVEEHPLLLHPYFDDPTEVLGFTKEGVAHARTEPLELPAGPTVEERAEASIRVYALNRLSLVNERRATVMRIERIKTTIVLLMEAMKQLAAEPETPAIKLVEECVQQVIDQELRELATYLDDSSEFAGLARERIEKFFDALKHVPAAGA